MWGCKADNKSSKAQCDVKDETGTSETTSGLEGGGWTGGGKKFLMPCGKTTWLYSL